MLKSIILSATLSVTSTAGYAATVFQNNPVSATSANCTFQCFGQTGAENFSLASNTLVTDFSFDVVTNNTASVAGTSIDWGLHMDSTGTPGVSVASGTNAFASSSLGTSGSFDRLRVEVDIADTLLSAGNYWLSLALTAPSGASSIYWLRATDGDSLSARSDDGGLTWSTPYASSANGFAFAINGGVAPVPLPAGLPLLLAGLGAMAVVRRKKA